MGESDHNKHRKNDTGDIEKLAAEYSYLDYLIEKRFYKKYWRTLNLTLGGFAVLFTVLAVLGIRECSDLRSMRQDAEEASAKIQTVYRGHVQQDSLRMLRLENSQCYAYYLTGERPGMRESIGKRFEYYGFGFAGYKIEDSLNWYLYDGGHWYGNAAHRYIVAKSKANKDNTSVGIVDNGLSDAMRNRVDSVFREIYPDAEIEHFEDSLLPKSGFLYFIH